MGKWLALVREKSAHPPTAPLPKLPKGAFDSFDSAPAGVCTDSRGRVTAPDPPPAAERDEGPLRAPGRLIARASEAPVMLARPRPAGTAPAELPAPAAPVWPKAADSRPYRLSIGEADAAHADAWDDATIARFQARVAALRRRGFTEQAADDLAERSHLLDVQAEGRALCLTCRHLAGAVATGWRCGNHRAADVARDLAPELVTRAQRCPGFSEVLG